MSSLELTVITVAVFILFALQRVYAGKKETIGYLERIEGLLGELRDDTREHRALHRALETKGHHILGDGLQSIETGLQSIETALDNIPSGIDEISQKLSVIDMALHGDWNKEVDYLNPLRKMEHCLSNIEDCLRNIEGHLASANTVEP